MDHAYLLRDFSKTLCFVVVIYKVAISAIVNVKCLKERLLLPLTEVLSQIMQLNVGIIFFFFSTPFIF